MTLTMTEACSRLGCTPRQLRYRIKKGEIPARKVDGRWHIDERDLPRSPATDRQALERSADLEQAVADGLARRRARRRYTVEDLQVFTAAVALARELRGRSPEHVALTRLTEAAAAMARAVHTFGSGDKKQQFALARARVAESVALLHLDPDLTWAPELARHLEDLVLPGLGALLRRNDQRSRP